MSKLSRKRFFQGLALGTISLPFLIKGFTGKAYSQNRRSANFISDEKYTLKMVTTWPPNFPVLGEVCNLFAQWVNEMSAGRLQIKVYGGGELVPALECFDAVKDGAADIGHGVAYYWAGKIPAAQFFGAVPFGMNAQQLNAWILCGGGMELWEELYAPYNLIPMLGGNTGCQMGGWFNKRIDTVEDIRGLKMRMPGLGGKVLEKAGGAPVLLAGGDLYTGLERGVIDATEWIGPYHDYKMGFHQIAKYYYVNGWHETGAALESIFNKERFEDLPEDLQAILRTAMLRANHWVLSEFEAKNAVYLQKLKDEGDVEITYYPQDVIEALRGHTKDVILDLANGDPASRKIYEAYSKFYNEIKAWSNISERQYYASIVG
ncbi:MAG: TRAP transporter substrate-binding protein [Saprospiraceae bacterium]|nr:TRAP transporter substrate-binding protein [Saprospiraceae bacterium]